MEEANIGGSRGVATPQRPSPRNHGTNPRRQTEPQGDLRRYIVAAAREPVSEQHM